MSTVLLSVLTVLLSVSTVLLFVLTIVLFVSTVLLFVLTVLPSVLTVDFFKSNDSSCNVELHPQFTLQHKNKIIKIKTFFIITLPSQILK